MPDSAPIHALRAAVAERCPEHARRDPWTRVTDDDASLPPAGENVMVWRRECYVDVARWCGQFGPTRGRWDSDAWHRPLPRSEVLAWRREAGPGWLGEGES